MRVNELGMVIEDRPDTLPSPAGEAPIEAFEPVGGAMKRSDDRWIACDPRSLQQPQLSEIGDFVTPEPCEGLRLRLVVPDLLEGGQRYSLPPLLRPVVQALEQQRLEFFHAELMQGPEWGVFLALDNRMPALLCQQWLSNPEETPDEALFEAIPADCPVHVNLIAHDEFRVLTDLSEGRSLRLALDSLSPWLEARGNPIHQLTLSRSQSRESGVSLGIEACGNEQGSQGA